MIAALLRFVEHPSENHRWSDKKQNQPDHNAGADQPYPTGTMRVRRRFVQTIVVLNGEKRRSGQDDLPIPVPSRLSKAARFPCSVRNSHEGH